MGDENLPSIYEAVSLGGGFWRIEGLGLDDLPMPIFQEEHRAQAIAKALNRAYQLGHTYGRGAGHGA